MLSRYVLPFAGVAALVAMLLFAFTSIAWELQASPPESYPEIVFMVVGLPLAVIAAIAAELAVWKSKARRPERLRA